MEHTKEPWECSEHKFNAPPFEGTLDHECGIYPPDGESGPVAIASGKNDARRIVACVNACAGVTTEELEHGGFVAGLVERIERLKDAMRDFVENGYSRERAIYEVAMITALTDATDVAPEWPKVGAGTTAEPDCDRSACGDFSPGRCDNPECPALRHNA